jgi:hypothetical protein
MSDAHPGPQPGQIWRTSHDISVEIVARDDVDGSFGDVDVIGYRFLGGDMVHLRSVASLTGWTLRVDA